MDFVIAWVNDSDPAWRKQRAEYAGNIDMDESRFRDWGLLKYWFRSVEENAPWVRKVFLVTCGQIPSFLNPECPKLVCVDHTDYIPEKYLPTFSSHPIELNLFRIDALSENFVYFNDDMFLNRQVSERDFFRDGLPCYEALESMIVSDNLYGSFPHILLNDVTVINQHFDKRSVYRKYWRKWINPVYGKEVFRNVLLMPFANFQGFVFPHVANPMRKSVMQEVWNAEGQVLDRTCSHRFRDMTDVNQFLFQYWSMMSGNFISYKYSSKYFGINDANISEAVSEIEEGSKKLICINDNEKLVDFERARYAIECAFASRYSKKSSFEL